MQPVGVAALQFQPPTIDGEVVAVAAGVVVLVLAYVLVSRYVPTYNDLVELEENVKQAKGDVDALLQRRQDELNRLSIAVREATGHESNTLSEVVKAREVLDAAGAPDDRARTDQHVQRALMQLDARTEEYPDIGAIGNIQKLQENIVAIEEELADRRSDYNEEVTKYNKTIRKFPESALATLGGFEQKDQFQPSGDVFAGEGMGLEPPTRPEGSLERPDEGEPSLESRTGGTPTVEEGHDRRRALETPEDGERPDGE